MTPSKFLLIHLLPSSIFPLSVMILGLRFCFVFKCNFKSNNIHSPYNIPEVAGGNMNEEMPDSRNCTFKYSVIQESFPGFHRLHITSNHV